MTEDKTSGWAFACAAENGHQPGMTLRDYFAGQALAGLAGAVMGSRYAANAVLGEGDPKDVLAEMSYEFADSMLAERNKEEGK